MCPVQPSRASKLAAAALGDDHIQQRFLGFRLREIIRAEITLLSLLRGTSCISCLSRMDKGRFSRPWLGRGPPAAARYSHLIPPCVPVPTLFFCDAEIALPNRPSMSTRVFVAAEAAPAAAGRRSTPLPRPLLAARALPCSACGTDSAPRPAATVESCLQTCQTIRACTPPADRAAHIRAARCLLSSGPCSAGDPSTAYPGRSA